MHEYYQINDYSPPINHLVRPSSGLLLSKNFLVKNDIIYPHRFDTLYLAFSIQGIYRFRCFSLLVARVQPEPGWWNNTELADARQSNRSCMDGDQA